MELQMNNCFFQDFHEPFFSSTDHHLLQPTDHQTPPSSSSSSLRSISHNSPKYSTLLYDTPSTSHLPETACPHQQAIRALSRTRSGHVPSIESEDFAMMESFLAVISSPSSSSSTNYQSRCIPSPASNAPAGGFERYRPSLGPRVGGSGRNQRESLMKKSNTMPAQAREDSRLQMLNVISERKRREKLNQSFQALRSLLPPGTKKDKATVLSVATDHLTSLKAQVSEIKERNQTAEAQLLAQKTAAALEVSDQRVDVWITHLSESTSEEARMLDLHVMKGGEASILDMVISLLEFLKNDQNINLMSLEVNTMPVDSSLLNTIILRLIFEGTEGDETALEEAVRRILIQ